MRKGIGSLYLTAGALLLAQMSVASLKAAGYLGAVHIDAAAWSRLFFGHFLFTSVAPIIYVTLASWSGKRFELQALVDALVGLLAYIAAFTVTALLLTTLAWITPWISLWPGFVLIWYGFRLRRGRQFPSLELR